MEVGAVKTPSEFTEADILARIEQAVAEKEQELRQKEQERVDARTRVEQIERKRDEATATFEKQLAAMREQLNPCQLQIVGSASSGRAGKHSPSRLVTDGEAADEEGRAKQARQAAAKSAAQSKQ